jgi:hypothetical protein
VKITIMDRVRRRVYKMGFRPKIGSPLFSPAHFAVCVDKAHKQYDRDIAHIKEDD